MGAVLDVSTLAYLPYCLFNMISPILSVTYDFTGFKVHRIEASADGVEVS